MSQNQAQNQAQNQSSNQTEIQKATKPKFKKQQKMWIPVNYQKTWTNKIV